MANLKDLLVNGSARVIGTLYGDVAGHANTYFVKGTQTAKTGTWTGDLPKGVTSYYDGLSIDYFLPYAGSGSATLNLGGLGAKPIYLSGSSSSSLTTHFAQFSVIHLTYVINSSLNSGNGCWKATSYYDSSDNYTNKATEAFKVGTTGITAYDLVAQDGDGLLVPAHSVAHSVGSRVFITTSTRAASYTGSWLDMYDRHYSITLKKSGTALTTTQYAPIFLKGSISGSTFTPDTTTPYVFGKSNCNVSGSFYMYVGDATNTSGTISLSFSHPYYYYNGSALVKIAVPPFGGTYTVS